MRIFLSALSIIAIMATATGASADDATYRIQVELNRKGCPVGEPDGVHGERTTDGLRCFQAREGLRVTGEPTGRTLARLFARDEEPDAGAEVEPEHNAAVFDRSTIGRCGERITANGEKKYGEGRAKSDAIKVWQTNVANRYGTSFVRWENTKEGRVECRPACATCTISFECEVTAIPCRE